MQALRRVYQVMEMTPPPWQALPPPQQPPTALLKTYADYLAQVRGLPAVTVRLQLRHVGKLLDYLAGQEKSLSSITLLDIDEFLIPMAQRYARSTTAGIASSLRAFTRFLFASQRIPNELAEAEDREMLITAELSRTAIAKARFELPTHRDADTPLIRELMAGYR